MNFLEVFSMECLICNEEKTIGKLKCKFCGMNIDRKAFRHRDFAFCSKTCIKFFEDMMTKYEKFGEFNSRNVLF